MTPQKQLKDLDSFWQNIAAEYARGVAVYALSVHYECSEETIRQILTAHGIEIRKADDVGESKPEQTVEANPTPPPDTEPPKNKLVLPEYDPLRPPGWRMR
jgi:hypothetical protein